MQNQLDLSPPATDPICCARALADELARVDLLLRRQVRLWQLAGQDPADDFRGLYVSDAVADALLDLPFGGTWGSRAVLPPEEEDEFLAALHRLASPNAKDTRLKDLAAAFGLDEFEVTALTICLAPALDLRYERVFGYLQDDVTRRRASTHLILSLAAPAGPARLDFLVHFRDDAPLLKYHLLQPVPDPNGVKPSVLGQAYQVDEAVIAFLLGSCQPHTSVRGYAQFEPCGPGPADEALAGEAWARLRDDLTTRPDLLEQSLLAFSGPDLAAQDACARLLARLTRRPLYTLDARAALAADESLPRCLDLAQRDARLTGALLRITQWDACLVDGAPPTPLMDQPWQNPRGVVLCSQAGWLPQSGHGPGGRGKSRVYWLAFPAPRYTRRVELWQQFLRVSAPDDQPPPDPSALAGHFLLTSGQIRDAVASARDASQQERRPLTAEDLFSAARSHSNPRLSSLAQKITPRYNWRDIILPADQLAQLHEIITTVRQRALVLDDWGLGQKLVASQGVTVLFAGPPGTGKTMSAEIIAGELGLDLYKIDLSTVISKYIGETEKNLERIFSEAASSNAILFFDEADALFGKRSEVRDSHDRYANIEISYLLQRMEAYDGVTILATNLRANLDEAFTRRLQFSVDFPFPDETDRLRIWQALFPAGLPCAPDLDLAFLARRYKLAGGSIRNILVSAAYLAAADGGQVTMQHLLHGTRRELQKMGKLAGSEALGGE